MAGKEKGNKMKKILALVAVVIILTGSVGMTAAAAVDPSTCEHPQIVNITYDKKYTTQYTHPLWVANTAEGVPILVTCTVTATNQRWKRICVHCGQVFKTWSETVSESHSLSHN